MEAQPLTARNIIDCPDCMLHLDTTPHLYEACASVGIEYGKSARQLLLQYLATFHRHGHRNWRE